MRRLFVAISLPEKIKDEIEMAQSELNRWLPENPVRWTRREQIHLTLKFLGNVEAGRIETLIAELTRSGENFLPIELCAAGIGFFPNAKSPRIVWVGVGDAQNKLSGLQLAVNDSVRDFTRGKTGEQFSGHVTIGRVKNLRRCDAKIFETSAGRFSQKNFGEWTANEIVLVRSEPLPGGSRYTTLARISLAGK